MQMGQAVNRLVNSTFFESDEPEVILTRFGKIVIDKSRAITFARGVLGMPDRFHFCMTEFPSEKLHRFKLLQSLDDHALSFITLPIDLHNAIIASDDICALSKELDITLANLAVVLIVTVHRTPGKTTLSVNARAPLFIDTAARTAVQHVFPSDKYSVQHVISV